MKTGSAFNSIYDRTVPLEPEAGMGATILMWTDRHACTIVAVSEDRKTLWVREDKAIRTDDHGMSDAQSYRYEPDENGTAAMVNPYQSEAKWARHAILRFAFGAPHDSLRTTRLVTMVALRKATIDILRTPANSIHLSACEGLVTVEYTRHPEAKGLRGLMKMVDKTDHPDGFRLIYAADWTDLTLEETVRSFVTKEETWQKARVQ